MEENHPRLFFALKSEAPWPKSWPEGRVVEEQFRHDTLAFLKSSSLEEIEKILPSFPTPPFQIAPSGRFVSCKLLPEKDPRVVAYKVDWFETEVSEFREKLALWLKEAGISIDPRPWLSHVTVCRTPFEQDPWVETFHSLPFFSSSVHLYESLGHSKYKSLWSHSFHVPFEEIEHTADLAFRIYGKDLRQLYVNAFTALSFEAQELTPYFIDQEVISVEEIVMLLNDAVHELDRQIGCPFKAVSFHGGVSELGPNLLKWEMIVDV